VGHDVSVGEYVTPSSDQPVKSATSMALVGQVAGELPAPSSGIRCSCIPLDTAALALWVHVENERRKQM